MKKTSVTTTTTKKNGGAHFGGSRYSHVDRPGKTPDLNHIYTQIGDKPGVKRLFALALKKIDAGESPVVFSARELVFSRLYTSEQCARVGFDRLMSSLSKVRAGRTPVFTTLTKSGDTYRLTPNPSLNLSSAVLGFRALPDAVLAAPAARPRAKMRDLAVAIFCEAQRLAKSLARDGSIEIPFRRLQLTMGLPLLAATASAVGKITLRDPLERAIARLDSLDIPGLSVTPHYTDGNIGEYLDGSYLTVTFTEPLLSSFLAAFNLTPAAKEPAAKPSLIDVSLHPLVGVLADRREMLEQGIEYIKKERLWSQRLMQLSGTTQNRHTSYAALGDRLIDLEARLALYHDLTIKSCADDPEEVIPFLFEASDFYLGVAHSPTVSHQERAKFTVMGAEAYVAATMVQDAYKIPEPEPTGGVIFENGHVMA